MAKKKLIETIEFDNYAYAKDVFEQSTKKLERIKIGLIVAAVATACTALAFVLSNIDILSTLLLVFAFFGSIAAYIIGGGVKIALKAAAKLAVIGWLIVPFPIDLITGIITLIFAPMAFLFVPLVFVFINFWQNKKNRDDAANYLQYCKQTTMIVDE